MTRDPDNQRNLQVVQCSKVIFHLVETFSEDADELSQCGSARVHTNAGVVSLHVKGVLVVDKHTLASEQLVGSG